MKGLEKIELFLHFQSPVAEKPGVLFKGFLVSWNGEQKEKHFFFLHQMKQVLVFGGEFVMFGT